MLKKLLSLSFVFLVSLLSGEEPDSLMFPACFQKNVFHICEGFPGLLGFYPINEPASVRADLILEIPGFLKFRESQFFNAAASDPAQSEAMQRDGISYERVRISLSRSFISNWSSFQSSSGFPYYLKQIIVLDAVPGSEAKTARLYWRMETDRGATAEKSLLIKVLPPIPMPVRPAKDFSIGISAIEMPGGKYEGYAREICRYLKGLTSARIYANLKNDTPVPDPQFVAFMNSGSVCYFPNFRPDPLEREIRLGKLNDKFPTTADHRGHRGLALSYMADDPDGFFAQYLKDGIERFRKASPSAKYIRWDYEPLATQYSQYDLESFRRTMNLDHTPEYSEAVKSHAREWSDFLYSQSEKLIKKYSEALHQYWPEAGLMLVSGFMDRKHPENKYRSSYTPVDLREIEKYIDLHSPMIYWQGTDFFDDVALNMKFLQKPFIPWIDPFEHSKLFFDRYTPDGVRQNILACAVLGTKGIIFYPAAGMDGLYYRKTAEAFAMIAESEDILAGEDISESCTVEAANVIRMDMPDVSGKSNEVIMPQLNEKIRWRVRRKDERFAVALFNYNEKTVFLRLNIPGFAVDSLVKLAPSDAVILTRLPEQEPLQTELKKEIDLLQKNLRLDDLADGQAGAAWRAMDGKAFPALISGGNTLVVDQDMAAPRSWFSPGRGDPLFFPRRSRGHLGRIFLMDSGTSIPLKFELKGFVIEKDCPTMKLEHVQKPFTGFQEMENRFEGLHITAQWVLTSSGKSAILRCTAENKSTKNPIPIRLKIQTIPRISAKPGSPAPGILKIDGRTIAGRPDGNFLLVKPDKQSGMSSPLRPEYEWKNPGCTVISGFTGRYPTVITITPDPKAAAFYNWYGAGELSAEFLTDEVTLAPGEKTSWDFSFDYAETTPGSI